LNVVRYTNTCLHPTIWSPSNGVVRPQFVRPPRPSQVHHPMTFCVLCLFTTLVLCGVCCVVVICVGVCCVCLLTVKKCSICFLPHCTVVYYCNYYLRWCLQGQSCCCKDKYHPCNDSSHVRDVSRVDRLVGASVLRALSTSTDPMNEGRKEGRKERSEIRDLIGGTLDLQFCPIQPRYVPVSQYRSHSTTSSTVASYRTVALDHDSSNSNSNNNDTWECVGRSGPVRSQVLPAGWMTEICRGDKRHTES